MVPEPSVPFYMALSVYVPLLIIAYLAVYGTLRLFFWGLRRLASQGNERGRDALGTREMHLPPAAGRA